MDPAEGEGSSAWVELPRADGPTAGTRFLRLMTVFFIATGRGTPCSLWYRPDDMSVWALGSKASASTYRTHCTAACLLRLFARAASCWYRNSGSSYRQASLRGRPAAFRRPMHCPWKRPRLRKQQHGHRWRSRMTAVREAHHRHLIQPRKPPSCVRRVAPPARYLLTGRRPWESRPRRPCCCTSGSPRIRLCHPRHYTVHRRDMYQERADTRQPKSPEA